MNPVSVPDNFLLRLSGKWRGTVRTWFEPEILADESSVTGEITPFLNGKFIRHRYEGAIQGKTRIGEETIVLNGATNRFQVAWMDSFHMNYAIMISEGTAVGNGCSVFGKYSVGPEHPEWGWRTTYQLNGDNHLVITAYNVSPEGDEAKAVETRYERIVI